MCVGFHIFFFHFVVLDAVQILNRKWCQWTFFSQPFFFWCAFAVQFFTFTRPKTGDNFAAKFSTDRQSFILHSTDSTHFQYRPAEMSWRTRSFLFFFLFFFCTKKLRKIFFSHILHTRRSLFSLSFFYPTHTYTHTFTLTHSCGDVMRRHFGPADFQIRPTLRHFCEISWNVGAERLLCLTSVDDSCESLTHLVIQRARFCLWKLRVDWSRMRKLIKRCWCYELASYRSIDDWRGHQAALKRLERRLRHKEILENHRHTQSANG